MNNRAIVRTQTRSVWEDKLTFSSGFPVGFSFLLFLSASLSKSLIHEMTSYMAVSVFLPLRDVNYPELLHKRANYYLFVLNTHGWPWKAFTDTSKCTRIWSRLMSPDVQTTSLQLMFLPEVKQNLITALLTLLSLSIILKRIVFLSPSLKVFKIIKYDLKLFWF